MNMHNYLSGSQKTEVVKFTKLYVLFRPKRSPFTNRGNRSSSDIGNKVTDTFLIII